MERSSKKQPETKTAADDGKSHGSAGSHRPARDSGLSAEENLEKLILDRKEGKYAIVALISFWAKELCKLEENRHLTQTDLLEKAMAEVLGGHVAIEALEKRMMEGVAPEAKGDALAPDKAKKPAAKKEAASDG